MNEPPNGYSRTEALDRILFRSPDDAESSVIREGIAYWHTLRVSRRFPSRAQITLRGLGRLARYAILVRVIDGGKDYEYRFVGNVPVSAVGIDFQGKRMSAPKVGAVMRANYRQKLFDQVVHTGQAWVFKSRLSDDLGLKLPIRSETVYLPLGRDDGAVDHLLGFTVLSDDQAA
jgi:hypothetical protein